MALSPNEGLKPSSGQNAYGATIVGMALSPNEGLKLPQTELDGIQEERRNGAKPE